MSAITIIMQEQQKIKLTDQLQKSITRNCFQACRSIKNQECFDSCFQKFLRTAATVNEAIKNIGYEKHSLIAYKAYPQHAITSAFNFDQNILWNLMGKAPMAYNRDYGT